MLILDLRGLTFIDSSGIRAILAADARSRRDGDRLTIVRGPEEVDRLFQVTGIADHLTLVDEPPGPAPLG